MNTKALYSIGYGVYIVCSKSGDKINGQTANAIMQITSDPPTVAISINKQNLTHEYIRDSKAFSVSILSQDTPTNLIGTFGFKSGRDIDKFKGVTYTSDNAGSVPVVTDYAIAYLVGKVVKELDVGTHTIFIGELIDAEVLTKGEPMTYAYYHQVKRGTTPKTAATYVKEEAKSAAGSGKYQCSVCGYVYDPAQGDPDHGVSPGTSFEDVPGDWVCPLCGATKDQFDIME